MYACIYVRIIKCKERLLRKLISKEKLPLKLCLMYFIESQVRSPVDEITKPLLIIFELW